MNCFFCKPATQSAAAAMICLKIPLLPHNGALVLAYTPGEHVLFILMLYIYIMLLLIVCTQSEPTPADCKKERRTEKRTNTYLSPLLPLLLRPPLFPLLSQCLILYLLFVLFFFLLLLVFLLWCLCLLFLLCFCILLLQCLCLLFLLINLPFQCLFLLNSQLT